jgi:UDP-glucose 4-epimerase
MPPARAAWPNSASGPHRSEKLLMVSRILITGGAGYIGSHTCKALVAAGYAPVVLDDLGAGHRWAVKWGPLVTADIADRARVSRALKAFGIGATIQFAARAYVGESIEHPRMYFDNNISKALTLRATLLDAGIDKFVFSSCAGPRKSPTCTRSCARRGTGTGNSSHPALGRAR